jgi:hypothetical protein
LNAKLKDQAFSFGLCGGCPTVFGFWLRTCTKWSEDKGQTTIYKKSSSKSALSVLEALANTQFIINLLYEILKSQYLTNNNNIT